MKSILSLSFFTCLIGLVYLARPSPQECERKLGVMDTAVQKCLLVTNPDLRPFENGQDFKQNYCDPYKDWLRDITNYRPCLKSFQRTVFGLITQNMKKAGQKYCKDVSDRETVAQHSKCHTQELQGNLSAFANKITIVAEYATSQEASDDMIPSLCCGLIILLDSIEEEGTKLCNHITGLETGKWYRALIEEALGDAIDLMCGQYQKLETCQEKYPEKVVEMTGVVASNSPIYNHTAFPSLLKFIAKMDSQVNV